MEAKCPFWLVCGGAMICDYYAKQIFTYGDAKRNYIDNVCCGDEFQECEHYRIRISSNKENE